MKGKNIAITILAIVFFSLIASAFANDYDLEYITFDPNQDQSGIKRCMALKDLIPTIKPNETLLAEPKYRSRYPIYSAVTLGDDEDNEFALVFDESSGTGKGYDVLYMDYNNNEDLTDDKKIISKGDWSKRRMKYRIGGVNFGPVEVMLNYEGMALPYRFYIALHISDTEGIQANSKTVRGEQVDIKMGSGGYTFGDIQLGGQWHKIAIIDYNNNGIFNDVFKVQTGVELPNNYLYATGDSIIIDVPEKEQPTLDSRPYAKYINNGDDWYTLNISKDGRKVEISQPNIDLGTVKTSQKTDSLQLSSDDGIIAIAGKYADEFRFPVGTYQLYSYGALLKAPGFPDMQFYARGTKSCEQFQVEKDGILELDLILPIFANVSITYPSQEQRAIKAGNRIDLSLTFSGQMGQVFTSIIFSNTSGKRFPYPTFKVVDEAGKTIAQGEFRYG